MESRNSISSTISFIRFPMIIGIVMIHSGFNSEFYTWGGYPIYEYVFNFLSKGIACIFVPMFFFISGYLFFNKPEFNKKVYLTNIKKRISTLFIPYLLWTAIALIIFTIFQSIMPELQSGSHKPIKDWNLMEFFIYGLYRYGSEGAPFVGQFWFLRDLILICIISPFLHVLISRLKIYAVTIIGLLWYFEIQRYFVPGTIGLFFFCWGAYYQIHKIDFLKIFRKLSVISWLSIPLFLIDAATKGQEYNEFIHSTAIFLGLPFVFLICANICIEKGRWKIPAILCESTFFIYAIHEPYYDQIKKIVFKHIGIFENYYMANIELILLYIFMTFVYASSLIALFCIMKHYAPTLTNTLTGSRSNKV